MWTWIVKIALWALSGVLASKIMNSEKPNGWLMNILLGMVGGVVGSVLCKLIGIGLRYVLDYRSSCLCRCGCKSLIFVQKDSLALLDLYFIGLAV